MKQISQKVLSEGAIGKFCHEEVEMPGGSVGRFEVLYHPGASAVLPVVSDGTVLMLRQYRWPIRDWMWEIPAGKLDPGEAYEACARRELEEETGLVPGRLEMLGDVLTAPGFTDELIRLFAAFDFSQGELDRGPGELIEMREFTVDEVVGMIRQGEIVDAKTIAAFAQYRILAE